jgi:hypothetical protein
MNKTKQSSQEASVVKFAAGGFRYIPAVFQYSAGVAASAGFRIRRFCRVPEHAAVQKAPDTSRQVGLLAGG